MRLGGFVIHGNNVGTLGPCVDSLLAVCDEVVAIDSCSTDGSAELVRQRGAFWLRVPWRGYGAARQAAAAVLGRCDWLFFLDSDERLEPASVAALNAWRDGPTPRSAERVWLRDWVELGDRRYLYRQGTRSRLVRRGVAAWRPQLIVHESLGLPRTPPLDVFVEHAFLTAEALRAPKDERYAWLWALQAFIEGRRARRSFGRQLFHALRDLVGGGALFRGGLSAVPVAWTAARYHRRKYEYLAEFAKGRYPEAVEAYLAGDFGALFGALAPPALHV